MRSAINCGWRSAAGCPNRPRSTGTGSGLRCDMDGVPGMTEPPLDPAGQGVYRFTVPDPGTYWYPPHVGTQRDRGRYGPLIVEDPHDPIDVDLNVTVMVSGSGSGNDYGQCPPRLQAGQTGASTVPAMDPGSPWGPMLGGLPLSPDQLPPSDRLAGDRRPARPADPPPVDQRGRRHRLPHRPRGSSAAGARRRRLAYAPRDVAAILVGKGERYASWSSGRRRHSPCRRGGRQGRTGPGAHPSRRRCRTPSGVPPIRAQPGAAAPPARRQRADRAPARPQPHQDPRPRTARCRGAGPSTAGSSPTRRPSRSIPVSASAFVSSTQPMHIHGLTPSP